ncbi:MAG: transposase [Candidatus Omnitrophica bacterium]|nr:transposase [Candidatus Omnitrophota bacterium]
MPYRKNLLVNQEIYHVFTRSIAGYKIFNNEAEYERMRQTLMFYTVKNPPCKFSLFITQKGTDILFPETSESSEKLVILLAYCLMPTHVHLILKQIKEDGISKYANLVFKSYSKHFNIKHKRKGPLWEGRFKNVLVAKEEQFLHLTRYVHLNPVSANLVERPEDWKFSSYPHYSGIKNDKDLPGDDIRELVDMEHQEYRQFVEDNKDYQRELEKIKHLALD